MTPPETKAITQLPGISSAVQEINRQVQEFAGEDRPLIITGEPGTEKAFLARVIHQLSPRRTAPLMKITISWKLPTGMVDQVRACRGGTLAVYLQRDFPVDMQYSLLEMATDGSFADPISGERTEADVRLILLGGTESERFFTRTTILPELLEYLTTRHIEIPPLRTRAEDIPAMVRYATLRARETRRTAAEGADPQVLALFRMWHWPKNAEDLLLVTAEAALNAKGQLIALDDLPPAFMAQIPEDLKDRAKAVRLSRAKPLAPLEVTAAQSVPPEPTTQEEETAEEVAIVAPVAEPPGQTPQEPPAKDDRIERILGLARRLTVQSQLLSQQVKGPLAPQAPKERLPQTQEQARESDTAAIEFLEAEVDRGLDAIMSLRRQLARLNQREQKHLAAVKDLYTRLFLAGEDRQRLFQDAEAQKETVDMVRTLREIDEILARVRTSFPALGEELQANLAQVFAADRVENARAEVVNEEETQPVLRPNTEAHRLAGTLHDEETAPGGFFLDLKAIKPRAKH